MVYRDVIQRWMKEIQFDITILIRLKTTYWKFAKYLEFECPAVMKSCMPLLHWTIDAPEKMSLHKHKSGLLSHASGSHSSIPYVSFSTSYNSLGFRNCRFLRFEMTRAICWRCRSSCMSPHAHSQIRIVEWPSCFLLQSSSRRLCWYHLTLCQ